MIRNFFSRLMNGRYGSDQLNLFLLTVLWVCVVVNWFVKNTVASVILSVLAYGACFYALFRMMSRNYSRRRAENDAFLKVTSPVTRAIRRKRAQARDRAHAYFKCPSCGQTLRVPRGKGKISITCRNCGTTFQEKT